MKSAWLNLSAHELLAIGGLGIALLVLAIQCRQAYLLVENKLNTREREICRPELDLVREIRFWTGFSLLGTVMALASLIKGLNQDTEITNAFLNVSSILMCAFIFFTFKSYLKYLRSAFIVDLVAAIWYIEPIFLEEKE